MKSAIKKSKPSTQLYWETGDKNVEEDVPTKTCQYKIDPCIKTVFKNPE